jgi:hypothetical protein
VIALLIVCTALADPPATEPVSAGETVTAEVDSFLVPRDRLERLVALAEVGERMPDLQAHCLHAIDLLESCADAQDTSGALLLQAEQTIQATQASLRVARRQRNWALGAAGVVLLTSGSALAGVWAAGH